MSEKGADSRPMDPKGGTIIADRYQVDRLIARGGMAAVYLAHHVKLNRPVALKILSPPADAEDPESFEDRFRLEAETLASLDHANIVILHDFGETQDGRFFLAMEYVEGPRLSDLLRDGPLPVDRALAIIVQVCAALRYAHKRGVVHRDLKPSNMLVRVKDSGEEQVKVVDFGLVKLTEADQSITRVGLILGSPHCMAPEQIKGLDVDHRADIYATGILLFRTLTGQYPFHGPNSAATMVAHLNQPVPTFFSVAPDLVVPAGLEEAVRKCLEKRPEDRYPDMAALMTDLAAIMHVPPEQFKSVSQTSSTINRSVVPAPGRAAAPVLVAGAVGVAAMIGIGIGIGGLLYFGIGGTSPAEGAAAAVPTNPPPIEAAATPVEAPPPVVAPVEAVAEPEPEPVVAEPAAKKPPPKKAPPPPKKVTAAPKPAEPAPAKPSGEAAPKEPEAKDPTGYMGLPDDF